MFEPKLKLKNLCRIRDSIKKIIDTNEITPKESIFLWEMHMKYTELIEDYHTLLI